MLWPLSKIPTDGWLSQH